MTLEMIVKSVETYRSGLRSNARLLWSSTWGFWEFYDGMNLTIRRGFRQAWVEGMAKSGMGWDDMTPEEHRVFAQEVTAETMRIQNLADFIGAHLKGNGGKLGTVNQRVEMWVKAYTRIMQMAMVYAAKDAPLEWLIDAPKESCPDCLALNGKVKRASYWKEHITPKDWKLTCKNGCKCGLHKTDKPLSRGPLPHGL